MGAGWLVTPGMLAWMAAAAIPVALYYWQRPRRRELPWAAVMFLERALAASGWRRAWWQRLLLALRVLALVAVAVAWSQPRWIGSLSSSSTTPSWRVLVVDASLSMTARSSDGRTAFEDARRELRRIVEESGSDDRYSLVLWASPPRVVIANPKSRQQTVLDAIDRLQPTFGRAELIALHDAVGELVAREKSPLPVVVHIVSDYQVGSWSAEDLAALGQTSGMQNKNDMTWELTRVGSLPQPNAGFTQGSVTARWPVVGQPLELSAAAQFWGKQPPATVDIAWSQAGERLATGTLEFAPQGNGSATHSFIPRTAREHVFAAALPDDALAADNHWQTAVRVREQLSILALGGQREETRPFALAVQAAGDDVLRVEEHHDTSPLGQSLTRYDVVALFDVPRLTAAERQAIAAHVHGGGSLLVAAGSRWDAAAFADWTLANESSIPFLPVTFAPLRDAALTHFAPGDYSHPLLQAFRGFERSGLTTVPIWQRWPLRAADDAEVALAFADQTPAIVCASRGRGRVMVVAIPLGGDSQAKLASGETTPWSPLDAWPCFVPLVHEMLRDLTRPSESGAQLIVGERLHGSTTPGARVQVLRPDGERDEAAVTGESPPRWEYLRADLPGVYVVTIAAGTERHERRWIVRLPVEESDLRPADISVVEQAFPAANVRQASLRSVRGDWSAACFWLVLMFLAGESLVGWHLAREEA